MKIVAKLTTTLVAGMCLVLAGNVFFRVRRETAAIDAERRRRDELVARAASAVFTASWRESGEEHAKTQLATMLEPVDALDIRWIPTGASPLHITPEALERANRGVPVAGQRDSADWYTYVPLAMSGNRTGVLELADHSPPSPRTTSKIIVEALETAAVLSLVMAAVAFASNQWLVGRSVRELVAKSQRIARGDFTNPVALTSNDELAGLGEEMNAMCVRLATTLEQLRHADRLTTVGKLASGVAHELGTPLNVVSARAEMIATGATSPAESREYADAISTAVHRMTAIVRQLLQFARRTTGEPTPTDVGALVTGAVELLRPIAQKRNVEVVVVVDRTSSVEAVVDGGQIQQVVTNLVMNAVQASPRGAKVELRVLERKEQPPADIGGPARPCLCIDVADSGHGIRREDAAHVFEPFFTTKEVGEGTGLGLAVSYGIVRDHGGWIWFDSQPGEGTTFSVAIPRGVGA